MRIEKKKGYTQLFRGQFISIFILVILTISSVGFIVYQKYHRTNLKETKDINNKSKNLASSIQQFKKNSPSNLEYNSVISPKFTQSKKLQRIINEIVNFAKVKKFPTQALSITIIDVETGEYGAYQQEKLKYPASVVKLFWMVYFYAQVEQGLLQEAEFNKYLDLMITKSDNEAASYIIDKITNTEYHQNIEGKKYINWKSKRLEINNFFQRAGYNNINISQKTFPIPSLNLKTAKGSELKLRNNPQNPILNKISTQQVARLLYEIHTNKSLSKESNSKMAKLLNIDAVSRKIKRNYINPNEFNPVRGFLSASLPDDAYFKGKAGWTTNTRNDAGIIITPNNETYILVIFAEDRTYAYDWKIFPEFSQLVFNRMTSKK